MKNLLAHIVKYLVDQPENIAITEIGSNDTSILELTVGSGDTGKIIGRKGRMAEALRTILSAAAAKQRRRIVLEIIDQK